MEIPERTASLRIGELSRRLGVSDHVLRAWERRYGLLRPVRSAGGFRLYTEADEWRIGQMQAHLARGLSAAEAARAVLADNAGPSGAGGPARLTATAGELTRALREALDAFDEPAGQAAGATPELAAAVGARLPDGDPVTAAAAIGRLR